MKINSTSARLRVALCSALAAGLAGAVTLTPSPVLQVAANLPAVQELRGTFLQLGAFGNPDNAESFRAHLARQLEWLAEPIHIQLKEGMYRLHLGPYRDAQEAGRVAERIREALALKPFVVQR